MPGECWSFSGTGLQTRTSDVERPDPASRVFPRHRVMPGWLSHQPVGTVATNPRLSPSTLTVDTILRLSAVPLAPLHGVIRSFNFAPTFLPDPDVFGLIGSLPLFGHRALVCRAPWRRNAWNNPSSSLWLARSLELHQCEGIQHAAHRFTDLPKVPRFKRIVAGSLSVYDIGPVIGSVSRCSGTLESLSIAN